MKPVWRNMQNDTPPNPRQRFWCFEHEYERRNYRNGCGFCKHCGRFGTHIETGFDPLERCVICDTPTYWNHGEDLAGVCYWYCKVHADQRPRDTQPNQLDAFMDSIEDSKEFDSSINKFKAYYET